MGRRDSGGAYWFLLVAAPVHAWEHRRTLAAEEDPEAELAFAGTLLSRDFSNFSAWHHRSRLLAPTRTPTSPGGGAGALPPHRLQTGESPSPPPKPHSRFPKTPQKIPGSPPLKCLRPLLGAGIPPWYRGPSQILGLLPNIGAPPQNWGPSQISGSLPDIGVPSLTPPQLSPVLSRQSWNWCRTPSSPTPTTRAPGSTYAASCPAVRRRPPKKPRSPPQNLRGPPKTLVNACVCCCFPPAPPQPPRRRGFSASTSTGRTRRWRSPSPVPSR